jgi:hypothetical protein
MARFAEKSLAQLMREKGAIALTSCALSHGTLRGGTTLKEGTAIDLGRDLVAYGRGEGFGIEKGGMKCIL